MSLRLTLIAHAATEATSRAAFPADEGVGPRDLEKAAALASKLGRVDAAWCGPSLRTRQTATALGLAAEIEPALRDIDLGSWAGRSLVDVAATDAGGMQRWTTDPDAAPHGGEAVAVLVGRVAAWLATLKQRDGRFVAVTHAAVIRAAVLTVLDAGPQAFWMVDAEPLCFIRLQAYAGRWTLRFVEKSSSGGVQPISEQRGASTVEYR